MTSEIKRRGGVEGRRKGEKEAWRRRSRGGEKEEDGVIEVGQTLT